MKRILPYILIAVIVLQLFAPFSVGRSDRQIKINKNVVTAEYSIGLNIIPTATDKTIDLLVTTAAGSKTTDEFIAGMGLLLSDISFSTESILKDRSGKEIDEVNGGIINPKNEFHILFDDKDIKENTPYTATVKLILRITHKTNAGDRTISDTSESTVASTTIDVSTAPTGKTITQEGTTLNSSGKGVSEPEDKSDTMPACTILPKMRLGGCLAQLIYYLVFKPTSFLFALSGKALDFTLMYSISDTSYRSGFVVEGWGVVRDFCNMFFIFVLLYIAFSTILNLNGAKTKEMIVNVVIVGLLINFSLFATQVIIDASNILTRVFYNQKTIITGSETEKADGKEKTKSELGAFGEIKLSEAIVSMVNPQKLIYNAKEVEKIEIKKPVVESQSTTDEDNNTIVESTEESKGGVSTGTFMLVTLLASAVNIVGMVVFTSVALIFIGRVVMLWLAMIVSPIVFFSYTVPELGNLPMVGHKKWWKDTLSLAFVAPVFAFFMYLIVGFLGTGLDVINASMKTGSGGLNYVIALVVPFAFIMVLLMKAKTVAVSLSGEIGASLSKAGGAVAGLALGAATGGASMLGRATIGKAGAAMANSGWARRMANSNSAAGKFFGNKAIDVGEKIGKKDWDLRNTKLGGMAAGGLGVDLGKPDKKGGYQGVQDKKAEKTIKNIERGKQTESESLEQDRAAKRYDDAYKDAMLKKRIQVERAGYVFDEDKFKTQYEKGKTNSAGDIIKGTTHPKVVDAKETERLRMGAVATKMQADRDFWGGGSSREAKIIKDIKAKGKAEKPPLTATDKYNIEKTKDKAMEAKNKATEVQEYANQELEEIEKDMRSLISGVQAGTLRTEDVKKKDISQEITNRQTLIIKHEADVTKATAALAKDPSDPNGTNLQIIMDANIEKKRLEGEMKRLGSMLGDKEKFKESVNKQTVIINQQESTINQQNGILAANKLP